MSERKLQRESIIAATFLSVVAISQLIHPREVILGAELMIQYVSGSGASVDISKKYIPPEGVIQSMGDKNGMIYDLGEESGLGHVTLRRDLNNKTLCLEDYFDFPEGSILRLVGVPFAIDGCWIYNK